MPLKTIYRKDPPFVVRFDFLDIVENTGRILFYGVKSMVSGSITYDLTTSTNLTASSASYADSFGLDFGVYTELTSGATTTVEYNSQKFNKAMKINGIIRVSIPVGVAERVGSAGTGIISLSAVKLVQVHVGGGTTDLTAGVATGNITGTDDAVIGSFFLELGDVSNIIIKQGEKIRLAISYVGDSSSSAELRAYHSPSGTSDTITDGGAETITSSSTILALEIPFAIQT